ncbi:MAG: 2-C-methyl-D-erythritol 4-phosphate cytidylyltransferase [bacterium]
MSKTVALVPAAGTGMRMGGGHPKQYRWLGQQPVISHTLETLDKCAFIDQLVVIVAAEWQEFCRKEILPVCHLQKPWQLVRGGSQRQQSVYQGLSALEGKADIVVIHDAARPLISLSLLDRCISEAKECGACIAGIPVRDTLKKVNEKGIVEKTVSRSHLWMVQTPQVFRYELLWSAHQKALREGFQGTDDSALVEHLGIPVKVILGSYGNMKITGLEDLSLAEHWLRIERWPGDE